MAIEGGKASLYALVPISAKILNGLIFLYSNFFDGLVVLILRGNNHTISPDCRFGSGFCVDGSILFVLIVRPPSRFLMTYVTESFLPVCSAFRVSDARSSRSRGYSVTCIEGCVLDGFRISVVVCKFC